MSRTKIVAPLAGALIVAMLAGHAAIEPTRDIELRDLDMTGWDCVNNPEGTAQSEDAVPASQDRKSTRLNSSHVEISYAVFCLKKKTLRTEITIITPCATAIHRM